MQPSRRANEVVRWANELMGAIASEGGAGAGGAGAGGAGAGGAGAEAGAWLRPFADFPGRRRVRGVQRAIACARELFLQMAALQAARRIAQSDVDVSREDQRGAMELIKLARETESQAEGPLRASLKGRAASTRRGAKTSRGARTSRETMMIASDASAHPSVDRDEADRLREMLARDESMCEERVDRKSDSGVESKGVG